MIAEQYHDIDSNMQSLSSDVRTADSIKKLQLGFFLFLQFCKDKKWFTEEVAQKLYDESGKVFTDLFFENKRIVDASKPQDPTKLFLETTAELIASGAINVKNHSTQPDNPRQKEGVIGIYDDEYYYLIPAVTYLEVQKHLKQSNNELSVLARSLWKKLDSEGKLSKIEGSEHNTVQKRSVWFNDGRAQTLKIAKALLDRA